MDPKVFVWPLMTSIVLVSPWPLYWPVLLGVPSGRDLLCLRSINGKIPTTSDLHKDRVSCQSGCIKLSALIVNSTWRHPSVGRCLGPLGVHIGSLTCCLSKLMSSEGSESDIGSSPEPSICYGLWLSSRLQFTTRILTWNVGRPIFLASCIPWCCEMVLHCLGSPSW